jgi:hypothetical protein
MIDQKQLDNVEYFNCLGTLITNRARYTSEVKPRICIAKAELNKRKILELKFMDKRLMKCFSSSIGLCAAKIGLLRQVDQKHLESLDM